MAQNILDRTKPSLLNEDGYMIFSSRSTIKEDVEKVKRTIKQGGLIGSIDEPNEKSKDSNSQKYVYSGLYYIDSWSDYKREEKKLILAIMVMPFIMVIRLQQNCQ